MKKILIADDEPNIVAALEFLLQRNGYEVLIAKNGDEALRVIEVCQPDLVLLDIMMPQRSGFVERTNRRARLRTLNQCG